MNKPVSNKLKSGRALLRLIAIALVLMMVAVPVVAHDSDALAIKKPTIVLVHGAWADPSGWNRVVTLLQLEGYKTAAPTLERHYETRIMFRW